MTEPDCLQWCPVTGLEEMSTNRNSEGAIPTSGNTFNMRMTEHGYELSREIVASPSFETSKTCLDTILGKQAVLGSLAWAGGSSADIEQHPEQYSVPSLDGQSRYIFKKQYYKHKEWAWQGTITGLAFFQLTIYLIQKAETISFPPRFSVLSPTVYKNIY